MKLLRYFSKGWYRLLAAVVLLAALLLPDVGTPEVLTEGEWPELTADGFMPGQEEFVYADAEVGLWRYCGPDLKIEIIRRSEKEPRQVIWYEAEVRSKKDNFKPITAFRGEHFRKTDWPETVCSKRGAVLAINGDYSCGRWANMRYKKKRYLVGIQIRDGEIFNTETHKSGGTSFPNMDTLALYPDLRMEVHESKELTAEEYVAAGAADVLSFGPWLIRDGEINPLLDKFPTSTAPRTAIGMVAPGYYWAMMLEGRYQESRGGTLSFLAEKMLEKGCTTGFNLDGGETSCILFMGKQINKVGNSHNRKGYARKGAEFLAIGTSALVEGYDPDAE